MNTALMILIILGLAFIGIGGMVGGIFLFTASRIGELAEIAPFLMIPGFFVLLGFCFIGGVVIYKFQKAQIIRKGKRYRAKIYGYVCDSTIMVNGSPTVNVKVHYFDEHHIEKEAVIPTGFPKGADQYAIGMTMDIYEYHGKYNWDPSSVCNDVLAGEEELMDDRPVEPEKLKLIAVSCNHCGSSYKSAKGYAGKCPYCGNYINL